MTRFPRPASLALALVIACFPANLALADDAKPTESKPADPKPKDTKDSPEKSVVTEHKATIGGQEVPYVATAATILLRDAEEKPTASIFHIAYTRKGVADPATRPIVFSFNGGPGSSSVWMHLGLLGPRRVRLEDDGMPLPPPYQLVDNEWSLLDEADLVFIDPVSTGFSRANKPEDAHKFHGVQADAASVADFIRLYITRNKRWASPKFLIGESYGTTRAAALSTELAERHRMNLNGILLVSTVLNFQTIRFAEGNDLPYVLYLPTYAATAWYHKRLPADLQALPLAEVLSQAEAFAAGDFNGGLLRGSSLDAATRDKLAKQVARFTGLTAEYVERCDLRVRIDRFTKELLGTSSQVIGRFDARYKGHVRDRVAPGMEYDPSGEAVFGAFASTFNQYVRGSLNYETDQPYEILTGAVNPWNWGESNGYVNVADNLADAMTHNPFLRVHVSSGYFDLATPYFATRYTFNHLGVDAALRKNVSMDEYTAGHMMYLNLADLKKQKGDLARFIRSASGH